MSGGVANIEFVFLLPLGLIHPPERGISRQHRRKKHGFAVPSISTKIDWASAILTPSHDGMPPAQTIAIF
jgi:hypothetical protein